MDLTKARILAGACAILFGFAGVVTLAIALAIALAPLIGMAWAATTAGFIFLFIASIAFVILLQPQNSTSKEIDNIEHATAEALADLPFDIIGSILSKRPITSAAIGLGMAYVIATNPTRAVATATRVVSIITRLMTTMDRASPK